MILAMLAGALAHFAPPTVAAVHRVGPTRTWTTIQQAVAVANHGDVVLVDAGVYPAFVVDGKGLAILADVPSIPFRVVLPTNAPAVAIRNVPVGHTVTLQGFVVHVDAGGAATLAIENCAGAVHVLDARLEQVADLPNATLSAVVELRGCAAVALTDVVVASPTPRHGETSPGVPVGAAVDRGIAALQLAASRVSLTRCTFVGYDNRGGGPTLRFGGDGVRVLGTGVLHVAGAPTRLQGGAGGAFGGNAVHHLGGGQPDVQSCGVNPSAFVPGAGPSPGGFLAVRHDRGEVAPGVQRFVPACLFEAAGTVVGASRCSIGAPCDLAVDSFFPRPFWLFLGTSGNGRAPGFDRPLLLDLAAPLNLLASGTLTAVAPTRVPLSVPALPELAGLTLAAQAVIGAPAGGGGPAFAFTSSTTFVVVP